MLRKLWPRLLYSIEFQNKHQNIIEKGCMILKYYNYHVITFAIETTFISHFILGDLLRAEVMAGSERWIKLFETITRGELVEDVG